MHVEHKWIPLPRVVPFDVAIARNIAPGSTAGLPGLTSLAQVLGPIPPPRFTVSTALAT